MLKPQSAALGNLFCFPNQLRNDFRSNFVRTMAYIKSEMHFAGNHVCGSRFDLNLADCCYRLRDSFCRALDLSEPLRGTRERVIPKMHRSRARMIGTA